jgi:hypothetical protein
MRVTYLREPSLAQRELILPSRAWFIINLILYHSIQQSEYKEVTLSSNVYWCITAITRYLWVLSTPQTLLISISVTWWLSMHLMSTVQMTLIFVTCNTAVVFVTACTTSGILLIFKLGVHFSIWYGFSQQSDEIVSNLTTFHSITLENLIV